MIGAKPVRLSLLVVFVLGLGAELPASAAADPAAIPPPSPALIGQGKELFARECADCHGAEGKGDGPASYLLYPKPRNFITSEFRIVSTWERLPTDQDLFNTITRGMPGSSMPPWDRLTENQRWSLVYFVKSLSDRPWPQTPTGTNDTASQERKGVIAVPPEP